MEIKILNWMKRSKKKTGHAKNTEKLIKEKTHAERKEKRNKK